MPVLRCEVTAQGGVQSVYHNLNTKDVVVQVRDQAGEAHHPGIRVSQPNSVEIDFGPEVGYPYEVYIAY